MTDNSHPLQTFFDFYELLADDDAYDARFKNIPTLRSYLQTLWRLVQERREKEPDPGEILEMLNLAFEGPPAEFEDEWMKYTESAGDRLLEKDPFAGPSQTLKFQIADLRRIEEVGQLENEYLYLGIQSPTGNDWYNFDPRTYLDCAFCGMGFEEDDDSFGFRGWRMLEMILEMGRTYE